MQQVPTERTDSIKDAAMVLGGIPNANDDDNDGEDQ
jgi:hypothetical protein